MIFYINTTRSESKTSHEQQWGRASDKHLTDEEYCQQLKLSSAFRKNELIIDPVPLEYKDVMDTKCPLETILAVETNRKDDSIIRNVVNDLVTRAVILVKSNDCDIYENIFHILSLLAEQDCCLCPDTSIMNDEELKLF